MLQPKLRIFAPRSSVVSGEDETSGGGKYGKPGFSPKNSEETTGDVMGTTWRMMGSSGRRQWLRTMVIVFCPQDLELWDPFHAWPFFGL